MVNIPTTERQFYDTTKKVNSLAAYSDALKPAAESVRKTMVEQQKIRIDTNATRGRAEADVLVRDLQLKYQRTPNSAEYKNEMKEGLNAIWKKYGQDIDPLMQGEWNQTTNKLNMAYDTASNEWAFRQRQENAKLDMADGMNANYSLAYTHGMNNNLNAAVADLDYSYNQLKASATKSLGEVSAEKLLKNYKKQFIQNFLDGQIQSDPEAALEALNDKSVAKVFENAKDVDTMKQYALAKLDTLKKQAKYKNILAGIEQGNGLINKSMERNLSLEEINQLMPADATEDYKNYIYSLNGYRKSKSGSGTNAEKAVEAADIYEQMSMLLSNDKKATIDDFQSLQNNIYKAMNNKSLSKSEGQKILNEIMTPMAKAWQNNTKDLNVDNPLWFTGDTGAEGVIQSLKLEKPSTKDKKLKAALSGANAAAKVRAYQYFYSELQKQVDNSNGKYNSIADVMSETNISDKRAILQAAQDAAIHDMASNKFNALANMAPEKQPNKVLSASGLNANTNNIDNAKQGTPVKATGTYKIGDKYTVEILDD